MNKLIKESKHSKNYCHTCVVSPLKTTVTDKPRIVLVFGVFDLLHPGHIAFLKIAKSYGDRLVVVVTRDKRAELEKGQRPVYKLTERMLMLQALDCVDEALPGDIDGQWNMVKNIAPHVICIGHDQSKDHPKFLAQLKELKQLPRIVQLPSFNRKRYSTSRLRELMLDNR